MAQSLFHKLAMVEGSFVLTQILTAAASPDLSEGSLCVMCMVMTYTIQSDFMYLTAVLSFVCNCLNG